MKCRATTKTQSQNKVIEFMTTATAYALFEGGMEPEQVKRTLENIERVADLMNEDYVQFTDIRKALKDEYHFEIDMKG